MGVSYPGNKGSSKTRKKLFFEKVHLGSSQKMRLFFPPFFFLLPRLFCLKVLFDFFYRVFGRFVTRGVQKRHKKKSRENLLSFQKKYLLTYVALFYFISRRPLTQAHTQICQAPSGAATATGKKNRRAGAGNEPLNRLPIPGPTHQKICPWIHFLAFLGVFW